MNQQALQSVTNNKITTSPLNQYWANKGSSARHNQSFRWFNKTKNGYITTEKNL